MSILERIGGEGRPIRISRIAGTWTNRDLGAAGRDAADDVRDQVLDLRSVAAGAVESLQKAAADAAERAGDAIAGIGEEAAKATKDATRDVRIDRNVDELVGRLKKALPTERIAHLVENLERELPTTDKGRYDRAYARGWARARTSFVVVGAAVGIVAGIAGAFLLDPRHGERRRAALTARARSASRTVSEQARRTATTASERAREVARERGLVKDDGAGTAHGRAAGLDSPPVTTAGGGLVPVMDPSLATPEPVMPYADGPVTDASSIEREPLDAPDAGPIGGTAQAESSLGEEPATDVTPGTAAPEAAAEAGGSGELPAGADDEARLPMTSSTVTSTLEPEAEDATLTGEADDRGTWHRTL